jgi:hypothetical protein
VKELWFWKKTRVFQYPILANRRKEGSHWDREIDWQKTR